MQGFPGGDMAHQVAVTVRAELRSGRREAVAELLGTFRTQSVGVAALPFSTLRGVHFARLFVLEDAADATGQRIPASLVYMADVDGSLANHLTELVTHARQAVDALFGHCVGYPVNPVDSHRVAWLGAHFVPPAAYYVHCVGRTTEQILDEAYLREEIEDIADKFTAVENASPAELYRQIRDNVLRRPGLAWATRRREGVGLGHRIRELAHLVTVPLVALLAAPVLVPVAVGWVIAIRFKEQSDVPDSAPVPHDHLIAVRAYEDFAAQNPLTAVGLVKTGTVRRVAMRVALMGLDYANRHVFFRDNLAGVRTIHFARWVPIDDGRRLIFASSYDGSAESYMDDFIDRLFWGVNLVFSNGVGYPRTRWLILRGAQDEISYKNFLASHQIPTVVFYSAYPAMHAVNIDDNSWVRDDLTRALDDTSAQARLSRL